MFCKNCGKRLGEDAKFCGGCGTPVSFPAENNTIQQEAAQEIAASESVQESAQNEPVQEAVQNEPEQENIQTKSEQEAARNEPEQETVHAGSVPEVDLNASSAIIQTDDEQKTEEPEPIQTVSEPISETGAAVSAAVVLPESFDEAVSGQAAAKPKKKKGKAGLIIGGTAVVLAGAAAAVGYFCFSNQIMRLIKGDAGYAKEIELKSYSDYIFSGEELDFDIIDNAVASNIEAALAIEQASENGYYENSELISLLNNTSSLDNLLQVYGDSEMKITADIEFYSFLKAILADNDSVGEYLDVLRSASFISRVQSGENGNKYTFSAQFKDSDIFRMEQYRSDGFAALTAPDLCDYTFYIKDENDGDSITIPREEIARIRAEMYRIIDEAYPSAEFTYTDGEFTVAGTQVNGTEVRTVFSEELCNEISDKISAFLKNDEFMRSFYVSASGESISKYEEMFSESEKAEMQLTICNYIAPHTKIIGKTIIVTDLSEDNEGFAVSIVNNETERRFIMDVADGGQLSVISTSGTENSHLDSADVINTEISFLEDKDSKPLVLDLLCENPGEITYCGKTIRTGSYTLSLSDKDELLLSEFDKNDGSAAGDMMLNDSGSSSAVIKEALKSAKIGWNIGGSENKLNCGFSFDITSMLSFTVNAELTPYNADEAVIMPDISGEKCINLAEEMDEKTQNDIKLNINEKTLEAIEKNDILRDIADKLELTDSLKDNIEEMKRSEKMLEHYSGYTQISEFEANEIARSVFESFSKQFWEDGNNLSEEEIDKYSILNDGGIFAGQRTIKLYSGEQGIEVIDDAGLGFVNFENIIQDNGMYQNKNMYIELTFDFEHALSDYTFSYDDDFMSLPVLTGVCTVYTDDPNDLPSVLPDTYNYIDGVFEWDGKESYKDDFVVGTYPQLSEGISTFREDEEKFTKEKEKLDGYALNIAKAIQLFMRQNTEAFEFENANALSVELRAGTWEILGGYDEYMYESDEIRKLAEKSGLSEYLSNFSRLNSVSDVRVQLLFGRESYFERYSYEDYDERQLTESEIKLIGVAVINAAENVVFSDYYVPSYYDYVYGCSSFNNYSSIYPAPGKLYLDGSYYIPFGSWCSSTNAELTNGY